MAIPSAGAGMPLDAVETPALIVDLDALDRNLRRMACEAARLGMRLRPHAKTHKSPFIAERQVSLGAVGLCCQTVREAEALARAGVPDVLVTNQVVSGGKIARLAMLARLARIGVCIDDPENAEALAAAARAAGVEFDAYVEIDVGTGRAGLPAGAPAVALARRIHGLGGLRLAGLQAYHGAAQHLRTPEQRQAAVAAAADAARRTRDQMTAAGLPCPLITGAGTGTYELEAASGVWGEIQPGSYAFMDADYARNRDGAGGPALAFEQALFVLATVISAAVPGRAVVDAGLKALAFDSGPPVVWGREGVEYVKGSDEHGVLALSATAAPLRPGDRVLLAPGHCDPTVNLHDWYVGVAGGVGPGGRVANLWPVTARGAGV